ncbi:MAG TPA: glycosyltransferase [Pseudomonadales bacterium]|nr:glycosyltransferase [Pseudomonadales bacterium]
MKPLVSILIPAYNAEEWIAATLRSALGQTWPNKEIIVVDDGSKDGTKAVAEKFSKDGVIVLSQKNQGASAARNKAFSLCHGDYIQWLDADDILAPDKILRQMEFAPQCPKRTLLSSEWGQFLYRTKRADFVRTALWEDLSPLEWLIRKMSSNIWMQPGSWLVSRELTEAAGPWDERLSFDDDGEYFCRVLLKADRIKFIPGARIFYRTALSTSLSTFDGSDKKLESAWLSNQLHVKYLLQMEESERTREAAVKYLRTWLPTYIPARPDIIEKMKELGRTLGGEIRRLETDDVLRWKFAWMKNVFGSRFAYWAQICLPRFKHQTIRSWDKFIFQFEKLMQPEL